MTPMVMLKGSRLDMVWVTGVLHKKSGEQSCIRRQSQGEWRVDNFLGYMSIKESEI